MQGHVGKNCQTINNPDKYPELKSINTMVNEQVNFWVSRYKNEVKNMNEINFILNDKISFQMLSSYFLTDQK